MGTAEQGDTVKVHYSGRLEDGSVFDSSEGKDPLEFTIGESQVIPGFESAVEGMDEGEEKTATIPVDEAYGPVRDELRFEVDRDRFPDDVDPEVGRMVEVKDPDGGTHAATITEVEADSVTLDLNHPLAGHDLTFEIRLIEVE
ncbi:MAG: peptidylprolyl isomerase [Gemmatimonadota bacterium]|nr:peptidylprolyl isomerase [Gemmatimonadota bacterium]